MGGYPCAIEITADTPWVRQRLIRVRERTQSTALQWEVHPLEDPKGASRDHQLAAPRPTAGHINGRKASGLSSGGFRVT